MSDFIKDFRIKNPSYDDLPDDQLVSALHKKYYSDIPVDQFNQRIGFRLAQPLVDEQPLTGDMQTTIPQVDNQISDINPQPIQGQSLEAGGTPAHFRVQEMMSKGYTGEQILGEYDSLGLADNQNRAEIEQAINDLSNGTLQPKAEKLPQDKSMFELVGDKLENWGAGLGERAGDIGGALLQTIQAAGEGLEDKASLGGFVWEDGDVLPSYKPPEEWAATDSVPILARGAEVLKGVDLGYEEEANWEGVKEAFTKGGVFSGSAYAEVLEYGLEQGVKSIPDMVATIYALPTYIIARSGEIGEQRAVNKGKEKAELVDILEAAPFAAASALLERVGAKGMTSDLKQDLGKEMLKAGIKEQVKRVGKSGGKALSKEAATEAIQEGMIEYAGERFGTDAKIDFAEALDRAAAGAVAGGVFGGVMGTATSTMNEINYSPEKDLARAMEAELVSKEIKSDETAADLLDPSKAQLGEVNTQEKFESSKLWKELTQAEQVKFKEVIADVQNSPSDNVETEKLPIDKGTVSTLEDSAITVNKEAANRTDVGRERINGGGVDTKTNNAGLDKGSILKQSDQQERGGSVINNDQQGGREGAGTRRRTGEFKVGGGENVLVGDTQPEQLQPLNPRVEDVNATLSGAIKPTNPKEFKSKAAADVKNKESTITELKALDKKQLNEIAKTPTPSAPKEKIAQSAYEQQVYSNVAQSSSIVTFNDSSTAESQIESITGKQTQLDIEKEADNAVQVATMDNKGKITYPQPKEDVNSREYKRLDSQMVKPPGDGQRVFNAPGHNFIGTFRSTGIPDRKEFVMIEGRKLNIPNEPQRIEPIIAKLVKVMGRRMYFGKIQGKSTEGFYRPDVGEVRTRKKNDVEILAHEMAHYLDFHSNVSLPNFAKLYNEPQYNEEVVGLSYTTADREIELIEGFAEFTRLWLTNSQEAQTRAPKFYKAFTELLARDRKLLNPMRDMQDLMHKFYFQGADKLGQALIGKDKAFSQKFNEWAYRRDSRIRQQTIDKFHAARQIEKELTGKIGDVQESAWKQLRIANGGSEGISDYIMNYGTVNFDDKGDLKRTGASLHEVLQPVKTIKLKPYHKGEQKIDLLLRYFAGRRALELHSQDRENLIPKETAKEWARLGKDYPVFESIQKEYQAFNNRMMDFYEEAGMITPEGRETMSKMNKDYVPFNRIREQLADGSGGKGSSSGFQKLKGGTANLNDILVNIQDGIVANVKSALTNRAKQRLYQYISNNKDGSIFATNIAADSRPVKVYADEMTKKIGRILQDNGVVVDGDLDLASKDLLTFWQHGVKPEVNASGNIVDSVIINGKPKYYEVQDPLLQDMLLSMNPESYSIFMNVMFGVKNIFTRTITLGLEFMGANLVRDTVGATFLSKNNFVPLATSFKGMYSFITKDKHYQNFMKSGGGYSGRLEGATREGSARRRVSLDEFGVMSPVDKLFSVFDSMASSFEYGTRIGNFRLAKKNMKSDMDAGFEGREISTDFAVTGSNHFITGYIRTVPFQNAMIQSIDRVFREVSVGKKYDGNPAGLAMKAFIGVTVPTLVLYMINKDDEDYKAIPDWEKRTNWHYKIGDGQFVKVPRPFDIGFVFATLPELFFKYIEDDKGKDFAEGLMWTFTQMFGVDGVPAMMTGWWDLVRNEKWTGAPVVPSSLSNVEAPEQYTSNTSETFVRFGEATGMSPIKAEHMFKAYTGYLGGYLMWGTDHMLWDEEKFGEKPDSKTSDNILLKRFLTPDVRPSTSSMEKFFELKEKSDRVVSTFKQQVDVRRAIKQDTIKGQPFKDDTFFGLSAKEKAVLFALNDSMNDLIKLMYGKGGIKTAELVVKHDKKLSGKEKRDRLDELWRSRNDAFMRYYNQANNALIKAKEEQRSSK